MMRLAAVLALSTTACSMSMSPGAKTGSILGGVALGIAGVAMIKDGVVDADHNGVNENPFDDNLSEQLGGVIAIGVGLALMSVAASARSEDADAFSPPPPARYPVALQTTSEPARLPELPASSTVIQLAQQVRSLANAEQCHPAWATWRQLAAIDQGYANAALKTDLMGPCTGFEPAQL